MFVTGNNTPIYGMSDFAGKLDSVAHSRDLSVVAVAWNEPAVISKFRYEFHPSNRRVFGPFRHACKRNGRTRTQPTPRAVSPLARFGTGPPPNSTPAARPPSPRSVVSFPANTPTAPSWPRGRARRTRPPRAAAGGAIRAAPLTAGRTRKPTPEHRTRRNEHENPTRNRLRKPDPDPDSPLAPGPGASG